jgi:membrane protein DedA with SNARE-associated domain
VVAAAAAIVGDNLGFWLTGRRGGRALIARNAWVEGRADSFLFVRPYYKFGGEKG